MFIRNGRFSQDGNVGAMTFRNKSVIDYSIVSLNTFEILSDFRIIEVDRLFSDGHSLLRVDLRIRCNPPKVEHPYTRNKPQSNFIKPSEFEICDKFWSKQYQWNLKWAQIMWYRLLWSDYSSCPHQIFNAFKSAASKTKSGSKLNAVITEHGLVSSFRLLEENIIWQERTILFTKHNQVEITLASRSYKRTMNIFINKYKFTQQSKLKGQPKNYWNFRNSLRNKKISETPP